MKLQLEQLEYQQQAIESVISVFKGQVKNTFDNSCIENIRANILLLTFEDIRQNIERAAEKNGLSKSIAKITDDNDICIEMETGTGKTLVYIKTIFELFKYYGFTKFIILVPSVAIKEGVVTTFDAFKNQLKDIYNISPCFLAVAPEFYQHLHESDKEFSGTDYFETMAWLKSEKDDLYDPKYTDMLRVAFTSEFKRGKLEDLVALLSGRNFETRVYEEEIAQESFKKLEKGLFNFINETNFKRFLMILRSAGFVESSMIRSQNAIDFAYIVYLVLHSKKIEPSKIESYVRRWFVLSVLTGRFSNSIESAFNYDIQKIDEIGFENHLDNVEKAELSEAFWSEGLPQQMNTSGASSPYFKVYLASQVFSNDKGFLSLDIMVGDLITHRGDVHHIFPKNYLKEHGLSQSRYNQIANYAIMQSEINRAIKDKPPEKYFGELLEQCKKAGSNYGAINDLDSLKDNFKMHCIPDKMEDKNIEQFQDFLIERRKLMALKIRDYYKKL